ncbi:helix-turn-helix domain-containing protein [Streptomyces sp. DSM 44917]|uniref:Helix-turn-helix domain-containing protein n=1 Tax=Streptomyces boetiae TaxID=3075541 RepID=A0ABU2LD33_9ACTN|nr:helix-turn-helix domain-containing protein [Streptomyces sp. DSM 44917]MDT0309083.1 helix-turn-helix domain-containing protein [Streptomyces sp. DSM 44917]
MARVSQEHLEARRRQILQGAARCFARDGFHATSMADVFKETGLSAGAVYRYFPSKEAIVGAIAHEVLSTVRAAFDEAAAAPRPPWPDEILEVALGRVTEVLVFPPPLVVQVWAETFRDPGLAAILREALSGLIDAWTSVVKAYQEQGMMRPDVDPAHVARTLLACAQGYMLQRAIMAPFDLSVLRDGLRALMSMPGGPEGPGPQEPPRAATPARRP